MLVLEPYLFFSGTCEAALEAYKKIFGGEAEIMRLKDAPPEAGFPADQGDRVMHARFHAPGVAFMASDGRPGEEYKGGNISMSIGLEDKTEADRIFKELAEGGKVDMPMQDMFWGAYFGQLTDRFGVDWMINCGNGSTN